MNQNQREQEQPKGERRFSQEQYDMLLRCSKGFDKATGYTRSPPVIFC